MYLLVVSNHTNTLSIFKKQLKDNKTSKAKGIAQIAAGGLVGQQVIRSGVPRALGVRLHSHSTSKKAAKEILKNGGILDPNKGGTGASRLAEQWAEDAKGRIYLTGKHPNGLHKEMSDIPKFLDNAVFDRIQSKVQRAAYRGQSGNSKLKVTDVLKGATGLKGKTLYVGGSDKFFKKRFLQAPDDYAIISHTPVKMQGSRLAATEATLKRYGKGNRLKGAVTLIKANPKRALAGAAILTVGGAISSKLIKSGINNIKGKRDERNDKGKKRGKYK